MDSKKSQVVKSNALIQGRYRFGLNEQRIMLLIVSKIKLSDKRPGYYRVSWAEIKSNIPSLKSRQIISDACERLKAKTIGIVNEVTGVEDYFGCISGWKFTPDYVEFRLDKGMQKELVDLANNFTVFYLQFALSLNSTFSVRIYEILKSEQYKNTTYTVALVELRRMLNITENSLIDVFSNFRRLVLEKAKRDLAKHTDIRFTYKTIKDGRRISKIAFTIKENKKIQKTIFQIPAQDPEKESIKIGDRFVMKIKGVEFIGKAIDGFVEFDDNGQTFRWLEIKEMLKNGEVKRAD